MTADEGIYKLLSEDTDVSALVGTRIYPLYAPQSFVAPYVTYQLVSVVPYNTKSGPSTLDEKLYQINSVGKNYDATIDLSNKVRTALDYEKVTGVQLIIYQGETNNWNDDSQLQGAAMVAQDYLIFEER